MKTKLFYSIMMIFGLAISSYGQDCDCDTTIQSSGNYTIGTHDTACIEGDFVFTGTITLKNGATLCVGEGVVLDISDVQSQGNNTNESRKIINNGTVIGEVGDIPVTGGSGNHETNAIVWLGSNNQNWTDANNWSSDVVPGENDAIVIPAGLSNYPRLPNNSAVEVGLINLKENAFIDLNGEALVVNGGITGGGMIKSSRESSLTLNDDSELFFNQQDNEIGNLTINSGTINLNNELSLFDVLSVNGGVLNSNDNLTLECRFENPNPNKDNYTTAQVGELLGEINGLVTVEQCYSGRRAFRYLTSSVNTATSIRENWQENPESYDEDPNPGYGTHITGVGSVGSAANLDGLNGFDWQPSGNPSMFEFNHSSQSWYATDNTNDTNLEVGKPFRLMIRGNRSIDVTSNNTPPQQTILRATGTLHKGNYAITIDAEDIEAGEHIFFANPYQTNVNLNAVLDDSSEGIQPFFYIWDPTLAERGAYSVIDLNESSASPEDSDISQYIMPQQAGFFVVNENGAENGITINFSESHKVVNPDQNEVLSQEQSNASVISLLMYDQEQELAAGEELKSRDGIVIQFDENGINEIDDEDAYKSDNLDENLARMHGSKLLTIERRAMPQDGENLQLFTNKYRGENYVFKINVDNLPTYTVYLKDNYTNELIELSQGENIVEFNIDSSINTSVAFNRFEIQFEEVPMSVSEVEDASVSLYPNPVAGSTASLQLSSDLRGEELTVAIYNTLGNRVYTKSNIQSTASKIDLNNLNFSAGVYIVKVSTNAGKQFTTKLIKK
ncbi:MAG: T9SS type A sorting domain-containing protein [Bacteroidota bacterium]